MAIVPSNVFGQQIRLESQVQVSPPEGGWYPWYEVRADPTNPANVIVCGAMGNEKDNAIYGFVYSSSDGGRQWHTALEDKNSSWVVEQSCAFGVNGTAYFVSESSKVIDGVRHHSLGTTRIFVSNDAGRVWAEDAKTGWADYSSSIVDTTAGPNLNRLYTFFNLAPQGSGRALRQGSLVALLTFRYGDKEVVGPFFNVKADSEKYQGAFVQKAVLLRDRSLLALFWGGLKMENGVDAYLAAVHTDGSRNELSEPVVIAHSPIVKEVPCWGNSFAYDASHDRLYASYHEFKAGKCRFMLTTSVDDGKSWSKAEEISMPDGKSHIFDYPAMAFNRDGFLGLMWRDELASDCWFFSISSDNGKSFSPPLPLSQCRGNRTVSLTQSTPFLVSEISGSDLSVRNMQYRMWSKTDSLTATTDGVFHAVWSEGRSGKGELRTAAVTIEPSGTKQPPHLPLDEKGTRDISQEVAVLYGGNQHYDGSSGTLTVDVVLKNTGKESIRSPIFVQVLTLGGEFGELQIVNASNRVPGPGAIWDLSDALSNGVLEPGATTQPYSLIFRVIPDDNIPQLSVDLLKTKLKVLASAVPRSSH